MPMFTTVERSEDETGGMVVRHVQISDQQAADFTAMAVAMKQGVSPEDVAAHMSGAPISFTPNEPTAIRVSESGRVLVEEYSDAA
jgi:hypothetical protein